MALQLAIQAVAASLSYARSKPTKPPSNGHQQPLELTTTNSRRRLATAAAVGTAVPASARDNGQRRCVRPADHRAGAVERGGRSRREEPREEPGARQGVHRRQVVAAAAGGAAGQRGQPQAGPVRHHPGKAGKPAPRAPAALLRPLQHVTRLDYAARDKEEHQVQEYYGNIVAALDKIFAKIM